MTSYKEILVISTGGTFNKYYNRIDGTLEIDKTSSALKDIASKWLYNFEISNIIGKDSLEMTKEDREELLDVIQQSESEKIIIIHGTDTMDITAKYLADAKLKKSIVLTGAMVPYSIDPTEATANVASAYGYIHSLTKNAIYIILT